MAMSFFGRRRWTLDVTQLPQEARGALEALTTGYEVTLVRGEHELGVLEFRATALEGVVLERSWGGSRPESTPVPEGVSVVATAMSLSPAVRRRLSDEFGDDFIVLDLHDAPATTDVLLVNPVSPQLLGALQQKFPRARVIVTEIEDEELGVTYAGPVGRMLAAGATAYLPPRPVGSLAQDVRAVLDGSGATAIEGGDRPGGRSLS